MESEQNERPTHGSAMGRHVSDNRVPPNTEEDEDINYPWTDCLLNEESDENSSIDIQQNGRKFQYNDVTICVNEDSTVNSGTDGGNSDIGVLADFSDDDEETRVEQLSGCRIPGCQCKGHIECMEWGSDDMTETDDSEYEGSIDRANRLYVESYNYDLSEGMTPKTYTPPLRKNRRRRYEVRKKNEAELEESISVTSDRGFQADKESPKSEPTVQPRTVADEDIPKVRDQIDDRGRRTRTGSDKDISSDEDSNLFDRPVTESATAWARRDSHGPSKEYWKNVGRPVIEAMTEMARNEANISGDNYPDFVKQIARETMRAWAENNAEPVEQRASCQVPGCQCNGRIEYMDWGSEDMTETDDSEYEDPVDRANRLYVESCNYDLSEGMTPMTYTPPLRKNRRRRYEVMTKNETDIEESICGTIDDGFLTDEESPNSEQMVQPRMVADEDILTVRDRKDNRGRRTRTGSDKDIFSDEDSKLFGRPVTESATAWAGSDTDNPSGEHVKCCKQPVTESVTARAPDTEEPLVMKVSTVTMELLELRTSVCGETDTSDIPVYKECFIPERRRPVKVSPDANAQVVISDNQWNSRDCCFGVCKKADSVNRSGIGSCWDCLCWLVWGYRVSCLAAIVIKDRSHGIDLCTEERRVCTSGLGLVGDPMTPCDVIPVYTMMNENFKGGLNNVMPRNKDPVDSRYHQRCVDNRHWPWTRASVCEKPIRERRRFGCLDSPVRDADWSDECSVGLSRLGTSGSSI